MYLRYLDSLHHRHPLTSEEEYRRKTLKSGYLGEVAFSQLLSQYDQCIVLWNISFAKYSGGMVQYDFIVIHDQSIFHFDIKNYRSDYEIKDGNLVNAHHQIPNPEGQLNRAHSILEKLIKHYNPMYQLESYLTFIHEEFHLYSSPPNNRWLLRSQLPRTLYPLKDINLNKSDNIQLAKYILNHHQPLEQSNAFHRVPLEKIKNGYKCCNCKQLSRYNIQSMQLVKCCGCHQIIKLRDLINFNLIELAILKGAPLYPYEIRRFLPEVKRSTVNRCLAEHFDKTGQTKGTSYSLKPNQIY